MKNAPFLPQVFCLLSLLSMVFGCQKNGEPPPQVESYEYPVVQAIGCEAGARSGPIGASDGHVSAGGLRYHVRTPSNYNPTVAHP
ncbi:MAG: hypothetical protein NNA30_08675, partial [Nitrospira sp.]|nr:hypothetical protein [Nitrospira sp.]